MKTLGGLALAIVGAVASVLVLLLVATLGLTGARSSRNVGELETSISTSTTAARTNDDPVADVTLRAGGTEFDPPPELPSVDDGDVLVVRVAGFEGDARGTIAVCASDHCGPRFPVNLDSEGEALIQYRVDLDAARCTGGATCRLEVRSDDRSASAVLASGASTGSARARVVGSSRVNAGEAVRITVAGVDAGSFRVLGCDGDAERRSECRPMRVRDGEVIVDTRVDRLVLVDRTSGLPIASPVPVTVIGLRPSYDGLRLGLGIAAAGGFLLAALLLVRRTEWREPASVTVWAD